MFQFRRFPSYTYWFSVWCLIIKSSGLLHSEICGSILACNSPQLIAAYHVLHRLLMPRHSPCALYSLTICLVLLELCLTLRSFFEIVSFNFQSFDFLVVEYFQCFPHLHYFLISLFNFQGASENSWFSWWAQVDSNHRPHAYQACALTTWAMRP